MKNHQQNFLETLQINFVNYGIRQVGP
uniref:Uncharacterized protein n=1 Tax=Vitis vinifera TaxID=29760 RepID=F6HZX6_VITVI